MLIHIGHVNRGHYGQMLGDFRFGDVMWDAGLTSNGCNRITPKSVTSVSGNTLLFGDGTRQNGGMTANRIGILN